MNLAIVAYPHLDEGDRQRIEAFRTEHDPQAPRLALHFTLVFPFDGVPDEVIQELAVVARSTDAIAFTIHRTAVVRDAVGSGWSIFLFPDEGAAQIATLHDRLYAGTLEPHLRRDIEFVPHITAGAGPNPDVAEGWAQALDVRSRIVRGTVAGIDLVDVGQHRVRSVATFVLGRGVDTGG